MNRELSHMWIRALIALAVGVLVYLGNKPTVEAQIPIGSGFDQTYIFDGIGTSGTATLPTDWRVDKQGAVRTIGTWAAAATATEQRAGNNMSSTAGNGIYNYGAGPGATAIDRAIGWISSGSGTASGNLYVHLTNASPSNDLGSLHVTYDVEKYRHGSNPAGFSIQLYYSNDGSTWTTAGPNFATSFAADADNNGYSSAPGVTSSANYTLTFASPILPGNDLYLAWNYSVSTGNISTNAQALGIDNVHLYDPLQPTAVQMSRFTASQTDASSTAPLAALGIAILGGGVIIMGRRRN